MKYLVLALLVVGASATTTNLGICGANCASCHVTVDNTLYHKKSIDGTLSATNNTCKTATSELCHADSTKFYCPADHSCQASNCNSCTGYTLEPGDANATGGARSAANNTCQVENQASCHADSTKFFCDVTATCIASNCGSCTGTVNGSTVHKKANPDGSQSATNNLCRANTSEICHADSTKFYCPTDGTCQASNCDSCTGYTLEPGDTNATGGARSAANNTCQIETVASCAAGTPAWFCGFTIGGGATGSPAASAAPSIFIALVAFVGLSLRM